LAKYKHIRLTDAELEEAILSAKIKKEARLKHEAVLERERFNRENLINNRWSTEQTRSFMQYRAENVFLPKKFVIDRENMLVFDMLCDYFSNDRGFISKALAIGVNNPSLEKGILLCGIFGTGKTWMMQLFSKNQRQCYNMVTCEKIAEAYQVEGVEGIAQYEKNHKNPYNDADSFFHPVSGYCFDEIGSEDEIKNFGNNKNVIGNIIQKRYNMKFCGPLLHGTTNMSGPQINEYFGGRVASRMREVFNFIELKGEDRRSKI